MPSLASSYGYAKRSWVRRAIRDHHAAGGCSIDSPHILVDVICDSIRRAEPGIASRVRQQACTCGYDLGWVTEMGRHSCWNCGRTCGSYRVAA